MHIFRQSCSQSCCFSSLTDRHNCSQTWLYLFCFPTNQQCVFSHFLSHTHQGENKEDKPLPINPNEQLFIALRLQTFLSMFSQSKLYHFTNCTLVSADMLLFFFTCLHSSLHVFYEEGNSVCTVWTPSLKTHYGNNTQTEKCMSCENGDKNPFPWPLSIKTRCPTQTFIQT